MRFATKILLLTLAITIALGGIVVTIVTVQLTRAEEARATQAVQQAINQYGGSLDSRARKISTIVRLLMEDPQNRAYLHALQDAGPAAAPEAKAQLEEEILGRVLQTELADDAGEPAFHVLVDARNDVLAVRAADQAHRAGVEANLRQMRWPVRVVLADQPVVPRFYISIDAHLYAVISVPLRVEIADEPTIAYFVGFRVNDHWVQSLVGGAGSAGLRVAIQLNDRTVARSGPEDAAERELPNQLRAGRAAVTHAPAQSSRRVQLDFNADGERFIGVGQVFPVGSGSFHFALYSSMDQRLTDLRRLQQTIYLVTAGAIVLAFVASKVVSRMLAKPVEQLLAGTELIARGNFNVPIRIDRRDELGQLARSFNQMAAGLEQRDLIKDTFGKFVDPKIVESMLTDATRLQLGGEWRAQTVLFADIENFTPLSERLSPQELFRLLNAYLETAAEVVAETHGIIDKFIGDGVVAFWGPPLEQQHALAACRAALGLVRRARLHDELCRELGVPPLRVRVGIATGELLVGNIGSRSKYNYTVMGDIANLASRLEGVNKLYGTQILVSARTAREAGDMVLTRSIDTVRVVGRREPVELFEVLGETGDANGALDGFARAMELYQARRWNEARIAFEQLSDPPAAALAGRCAVFLERDPGPAWDGVWNLDRK